MSARQRKRQSFAAKQRERRKTRAIIRANRDKPGFIGAVLSFTINGVTQKGIGAMFLVNEEADALDRAVSIETGVPLSVLRAGGDN